MHFYGKGIPLDQVPFGQFFFHKPLLLDIPKEPGAKLMPEDLIPHREDVKDADLLLIRTVSPNTAEKNRISMKTMVPLSAAGWPGTFRII